VLNPSFEAFKLFRRYSLNWIIKVGSKALNSPFFTYVRCEKMSRERLAINNYLGLTTSELFGIFVIKITNLP